MKKQAYISPATYIHHLTMADGVLTTLSGGDTGLKWGGTPSDDDYSSLSADVKSSNYSVWNEDWSN